MKTVNVGLIGFGTVGKGVVKALISKRKILESRSGISVKLTKIADKDLRPRPGIRVSRKLLTKSADSVIRDPNIDIVVELVGGINSAKDMILKSISAGKHVVTANKALLAEYGKEIFAAASKFHVSMGFEASVGGAIPIINSLQKSFIANDIELIYGILNGTSNFILSMMSEEGCSFKEALKRAQEKGIAERNPRLDISGEDALHKLSILTLLGFGIGVKPGSIFTEGIEEIKPIDIKYAGKWGYSLKPLVIAKKMGKELDLRVHPTLIPSGKILASVKYENNAIFVKGDMIGESLLFGKGAGSLPTASSVISDIIDIAKGMNDFRKAKAPFKFEFKSGIAKVQKINDLSTRYYLRFSAIDRPGVLAGISGALAESKISISTVTQKERKKGQPVPIVMLTHEANEGGLERALSRIDKLPYIKEKTVKIRIER